MDERRRLLERAFSREGANEAVEEHLDPVTGEIVRLTPSQWALAEYDRLHASPAHDVSSVDASHSGRDRRTFGTDDGDADGDEESDDDSGDDDDGGAENAPASLGDRARRGIPRFLPLVTGVGGLVLGIAIAVGVQGAVGSTPSAGADATSAPSVTYRPRWVSTPVPSIDFSQGSGSGAVPFTIAGEGDEGATLATVTNYFDSTPAVLHLATAVTRGFDPTSFRSVVDALDGRAASVYAARRLDGEYCLVAVRPGIRTDTCGTLDTITRGGLSLATDDPDSESGTLTVAWATDGTIFWSQVPPKG